MNSRTIPRIKPTLLNVMGDKEWTLRELEAATGFSFDGINSVLRGMHGQAYICGWRPQKGVVACAVWKLGVGEHVLRPAPRYKKYSSRNNVLTDTIRLQRGYFTSVRLPWELTPCHP